MKTLDPGDSELGIIISGKAAETIDIWRADFDRFFGILPPHITISDIPFIDREGWFKKRDSIKEAIRMFEPFKVILGKTGYFSNGLKILWLEPHDEGVIDMMRKKLSLECPFHFSASFDYKKHVTIGYFEDDDKFLRAKSYVDKDLSEIEFTVDRISYMIIENDGKFKELDFIKLLEEE